MAWQISEDAMPWVGLYIAIASVMCTLAMLADVIRAFWQRNFWFPNKFFALNNATLAFIAVAIKLPMDLSSDTSENLKDEDSTVYTKITSIMFVDTLLVSFLPSLALMNDEELISYILALGIIVITFVVDVGIQLYTRVITFSTKISLLVLIFPILCLLSTSLTVSTYRKQLEQRYKESQRLLSRPHVKRFSSKELRGYIKKCWMMTETRNPQFVIAYSPVSLALGVLSIYFACSSAYMIVDMQENWYGTPVYKWSIEMIFNVQTIGIFIGSIGPVFRLFTSVAGYSVSVKWIKHNINVFRVEKQWTHRLQKWKRRHVDLHLPGRQFIIVLNNIKNIFLNFLIVLQIGVLVISKILCFIPRMLSILVSQCCYFIKKFSNTSSNVSSVIVDELEEYSMYVLQIEADVNLSKYILRNTLHSISHIIEDSPNHESHNLVKLLEKSKGFNGVFGFDNDAVKHSDVENPKYCWSLVVITLTATAIALPSITDDHVKGLLSSMREGLHFVTLIEKCLDVDGGLVNPRKAAKRAWTEVELYRTWLSSNLQQEARKGSPTKDILQLLGDEAVQNARQVKCIQNASVYQSHYEFTLACSMYRISQTILMHYEQVNWPNDQELFEWISITIADVLSACLTNLPRVIQMMCHHDSIEKRGESIQNAAQLLGKAKKVLKFLKARQMPNIDQDSMADIDKWRVQTESQSPHHGASSSMAQGGSSSSRESHEISIVE